MRRIQRLATILAVLAAGAALFWLLRAEGPGVEPVVDPGFDLEKRPAQESPMTGRLPQGGVYAGRVVDPDDQPIVGAHVLLVAYATGAPNMSVAGAGADPESVADIPIIGRYSEGGEAVTDPDGKFRIAADSQSTITRVLAYHQGYFLSVVGVERPRNDIVLRMQRAGKVVGTVVDDQTGAPVAGARVDIYLQQKVAPVPETPEGMTAPLIHRPQFDTAWLATLGRFTSKVLGPRIWDVVDSGSETLRLWTDANGHFEIGPLGNTVQVEFVITHPDYIWYDFDTEGGKKTPQRLVVEAGATVEREFRMRRGFHISGQVMDDAGKGLADVLVKVQSISAYFHHWWYRDKYRTARTDGTGHFRVDGLTLGSQQLIFEHPAFKQKIMSVQRVPADDLVVVAERFGALIGTLEGAPSGGAGRRVLVVFESTEENPQGPRQFQRTVPLSPTNQFVAERVPPGSYRIWVKLGKSSSQPVELQVVPLESLVQTFDLGAGGLILARIVDVGGGILDPASVRLVSVADGKDRTLGTYVTREGEVEIEGVPAGRYKLLVEAPGRIPTTTDAFDVGEARSANLGAIVLDAWAYLHFGVPQNARGRPTRIEEDLILEYRVGEGPWQRVYNAGVDMPVRPGAIEYRARSGAMSYEGSVRLEGGARQTLEIVLDDGR